MVVFGKFDLVCGDSYFVGNLFDGSLEGLLCIDEYDRLQVSFGYWQGQLYGVSILFYFNGKVFV